MSFQIAERDWRDGRDEGGFIWLVSFNQKPDKPNNGLLVLADFFSILLETSIDQVLHQ
jgi:hypothetical protein